MEDLLCGFEKFKISALSKSIKLNPHIKNVTIGPNSTPSKKQDTTTILKNAVLKPPIQTTPQSIQSDDTVIFKKAIADLEAERQDKLQTVIKAHITTFTEFTKKQELCGKQEWLQRQQALILESQQQELQILQELEQYEKDALKQHALTLKRNQEQAERRRQNEQELLASEKRKQQIYAIIDKIKKDQREFRSVYQEIVGIFQSCKHQNEVKAECADILKIIKALPDSMEEVVACCQAGKITESECQKTAELVQLIIRLKNIIQQKVDMFKLQVVEPVREISEPLPAPYVKPSEVLKVSAVKIDDFLSSATLQLYAKLQEFSENYAKSYKELLEDTNYKQFRFDCKKAINAPVNAISAVSLQHLLDKYVRLSNLLSGKSVEVGEKPFKASTHPQGLAFCTDLLAKKFVLQGDLMISSNPEAAFAYATIIITLWNDFPDLGKLLLAHFYKQCPYLLPFFPPRTVDQTDEEFYQSQGYQYVKGVVEKHDKFLKRMGGIMRLYFAILVAQPRRGQGANPLDLEEGWRWLSNILNLQPRNDITATALHVFLEVVGPAMEPAYGKTFLKVMAFILQNYLPLLLKNDSGGPVSRLEIFLQGYRGRGCFETPSGKLPSNFW